MENQNIQIAVIREKMAQIEKDLADMDERQKDRYTTKSEFERFKTRMLWAIIISESIVVGITNQLIQ